MYLISTTIQCSEASAHPCLLKLCLYMAKLFSQLHCNNWILFRGNAYFSEWGTSCICCTRLACGWSAFQKEINRVEGSQPHLWFSHRQQKHLQLKEHHCFICCLLLLLTVLWSCALTVLACNSLIHHCPTNGHVYTCYIVINTLLMYVCMYVCSLLSINIWPVKYSNTRQV